MRHKKNWGIGWAFFSAIKEDRRKSKTATPDAFSTTEDDFFNLVCPLLLLIPKWTWKFFVQIVPEVGFFKIHVFLVVYFPQNHDSQYATELLAFQPALLLSFSSTKHRIQTWFMHIKQVYFVLSIQEEHISYRSSRYFVLSCVRMTKKGNVQTSGWNLINLMYL